MNEVTSSNDVKVLKEKKAIIETKDMVEMAVMLALLIVASQIAIPTPLGVPITLQTMMVTIVGGVMYNGSKNKGILFSFLVVLLYIILGAVGLPVFSGYSGGLGIIVGITGGYIYAFLAGVLITSIFSGIIFAKCEENEYKEVEIKTYIFVFLICLLANLMILTIGAYQMSLYIELNYLGSLKYNILTFGIGAIIKSILASIIIVKLRKYKYMVRER